MRRIVPAMLTVGIVIAISGCQPWQPPLASFESRVGDCAYGRPVKVVAMDDFVGWGGTITSFRWWGVILDPNQLKQGTYHIAIYPAVPGTCMPDLANPLFRKCLPASKTQVGTDCMGDNVFLFKTPAVNFPTVVGQKSFLSIAENDRDSARPGVSDFQWSGTRPIRGCTALWVDTVGNIITPLADPCDGAAVDLAFQVYP